MSLLHVFVINPEGNLLHSLGVDRDTLVEDLQREVSDAPDAKLYLGQEEMKSSVPVAAYAENMGVIYVTLEESYAPLLKRAKLPLSELASSNHCLTTLLMWSTIVTEDDCRRIGTFLNPNIQRIMISQARISDRGAVALAASLGKCRQLEVLSLPSNHIGLEGTRAFCEALQGVSSLTALEIGGNAIGASGIVTITTNLMWLTHLYVSCCGLGPDGVREFCASHSFGVLTHLNLNCNFIGCDGARYLSKWLLVGGRNLEWLGLEENMIHSGGISSLALAIPARLKLLDISGNSVGNMGMRDLCRELRGHKYLTAIRLSFEMPQSFAPVLELLHHNNFLTALSLNQINGDVESDLLPVLSALRDLKYLSITSAYFKGEEAVVFRQLIEQNTWLLGWRTCDGDEGWEHKIVLRNHRYTRMREAVWVFMALQLRHGPLSHFPREMMLLIARMIWNTRDNDEWQRPLDGKACNIVSQHFWPPELI